MTNRRLVLCLAGAVVLGGIVGMLVSGDEGAQGSTLSRTARGWLAARRYVESRGVRVDLLGRAQRLVPSDATLVIVFPWQRLAPTDEPPLARAHLHRGGTVILAYSGEHEAIGERQLLGALGLGPREIAVSKTLRPWRWRAQRLAEWRLLPAPEGWTRTSGVVRTMTSLPTLPQDALALHRNEKGDVLVARVARLGGHVIVLPAEALCNARLGMAGNADILEALIQHTSPHWTFDEYHHGLVDQVADLDTRPQRAFLLWIAHLGLCYLLAIVALARRFGPPWRESMVTTGSARSFFMGIGSLHARLRHAPEAATLLHSRARELDASVALPARPPETRNMDSAAFVRFAQRVAHAQQKRRR